MAIIRQDVVEGPYVEANGEHRGIVEFEFDDGRVIRRNLSAVNFAAWSEKLLDIGGQLQAAQEIQDAQAGVDANVEITAHKQANAKQRAVAYLRAAWQEEDAYAAFLLFDRFNTYRLAQGWTLVQVQANLASAGLTQEEWDAMRTMYQYLSSAGRPAIMADNRTIQAQWESR